MIQPGSRVSCFADEDYWGTVTARDGGTLTVDWDEGPAGDTVPLGKARFRHNLAVPPFRRLAARTPPPG